MVTAIKQFFAPPTFADDEKNRLASNLNYILWSLFLLTVMASIISFALLDLNPIAVIVLVVANMSNVFSLWLLRRGNLTLPALFVSSLSILSITFAMYNKGGIHRVTIMDFPLVIMLVSFLVGRRASFVFAFISTLIFTGMIYAETTGIFVPQENVTGYANLAEIIGALLLSALLPNALMNNLRQSLRLQAETNEQLKTLSASLETRVADRTRDLQLAVSIGQDIAQVRELNSLLQNTVQLICDSFNLYHVQIYLVDPAQQKLVIQAGTGQVGAEMLRRKHFLPINVKSIQGAAALEKQAILVTDIANTPYSRPHALLPATRSEGAVPLLVGSTVLGVLSLQQDKPEALSTENMAAFAAIANQLAVAIQNSRLFTEVAEARAEVETYVRRLTHEGWDSFLDGINQKERMGFVYEQQKIRSLEESPSADTPPAKQAWQVPLTVANEPIGMIRLEAENTDFWTEETKSIVTAVASQAAQQLENLRLLNETERFRQEAERSARRLSREAWKAYVDNEMVSSGFTYAQQQITPLPAHIDESDQQQHTATATHHPLMAHGEAFGFLEIESDETNEKTEELIRTVCDELSTHLENLRLTHQTERALAETQRRSQELSVINDIAREISAQLETTPLLETIISQLRRVLQLDAFTVSHYDKENNTNQILLSYDTHLGTELNLPPVVLEPHHFSYRVMHSKQAELTLYTEAEMEKMRRNPPPNLIREDQPVMASLMFAPMMRGDEVTGVLSVQSYQLNAYSEDDLNLISGVANYLATALQNAQLFNEIQQRGEKERVINVISQRIQSTVTMEDALKTAVSELGKVLQTEYALITLTPTTTNGQEQPQRN